MSGPTTTKESNSHTSRETKSSHKATPHRNSSSTQSRRFAAPKKSSSMAKAPVTSAGVVKRTSVTAKKTIDLNTLKPNSLHARLAKVKEIQDAVDAKAAQEAAEEKEKKEKERQKRAEERKQKIAKSRYHPDPRYDRSYLNDPLYASDDAATEPQRNSAAKKRPAKDKNSKKFNGKKRAKKSDTQSTSPVSTSSNEVQPTTTSAKSGLDSTEAASASHKTSSSPVPASVPGNAQDPLTALRTWFRNQFSKLTFSEFETFIELLNVYCDWNLSPDDGFDLNDIPDARLQIFVTWMKGSFLINEAAGDNAGDLEDTQAGATQYEAEQTEQSEPQLEKSKPSTLADGVKKHGKRSLDDDDDEQRTSDDSDAHRRKKPRNSEPQSSPREKSAHAASRKGFLDEDVMTSSIQNLVTIYSATINSGPVPVVTGGMIPFGADGHAAQNYHDLLDQRFSEEIAEFMKRESAKKAPKRSTSDAELTEPIAKKVKHSDDEMALLKEAEQATEESTAEAKTFKQEDIMKKPQVASSAGTDYTTETNTQQKTARKINKSTKNGDQNPSTKTKSELKPQSNKKPSASTPKPKSGAPQNRSMPLSKAYNERQAARNNPPQASTKGQKPAAKKPLADKSNTYRQPAKPAPKNTSAASKIKQPEAAKKPSAPTKPVASKKRKLDENDAFESTTKPAKQRKPSSKKRSREEIEDEDKGDDVGSTQKPAKKQQRTNSPSTSTSSQPDPHTSAPLNPGRASRRKAAAEKKAADAARSQIPRAHDEALWVNFDDDDAQSQNQNQNQAQTQSSGPVTKDEKADKQTSNDNAEHGVMNNTSGDAGNTEDAPASNDGEPQPQKNKKKSFIAYCRGEEPEDPDELRELKERKKKQQQEKRVLSEEAQKAKETKRFLAKDSRR